jgi:hypothetical protein
MYNFICYSNSTTISDVELIGQAIYTVTLSYPADVRSATMSAAWVVEIEAEAVICGITGA